MICIYKITNPSGKIYIGSTVNFNKRMSMYKNLHCEKQRKLFNSLKKHGFYAHKIEILQECSLEDMYKLENQYGRYYDVLSDNGLNLSLPKAEDVYISKSEETRKKISEAQKGEKGNMYGKHHSEESSRKISESLKKLGGKHVVNRKSVLDISTGTIYPSIKAAADILGYNYGYLKAMLSNYYPNLTSLVYA